MIVFLHLYNFAHHLSQILNLFFLNLQLLFQFFVISTSNNSIILILFSKSLLIII